MILTAPDTSSLAKSLLRWEVAEYCACALVAIACAGEYAADFSDWLTKGVEEQKKRLAKISTLLLIAALAFELICLVRTNSLSGQLIGSLSDKASAADNDAQSALDKSGIAESKADRAGTKADKAQGESDDALTKADAAERSLGKAESEANEAQVASSSALDLARGARKEADSFEKDIVSAKQLAAEAESHLAEALTRSGVLG